MLAKLLFFKQSGVLADRIRQLDGGPFSHVALVLPDGRLLEAAPPQVRIVPMHVRVLESSQIYRASVPVEKSSKVHYYLSKPYDWGWLDSRVATPPERFHCATLVGHICGLQGPRHPDLSLSELLAFCVGSEG